MNTTNVILPLGKEFCLEIDNPTKRSPRSFSGDFLYEQKNISSSFCNGLSRNVKRLPMENTIKLSQSNLDLYEKQV